MMNTINANSDVELPSPETVLEWQRDQYSHDERNHRDILNLSKHDRLKHYAMHYAKYVKRLLNSDKPIPDERTAIDILLVSLSAANTIHQVLEVDRGIVGTNDAVMDYCIAQGDFNNGAEKLDHLELRGTADLLEGGNHKVFNLSLALCMRFGVSPAEGMKSQRKVLKDRAFYIRD